MQSSFWFFRNFYRVEARGSDKSTGLLDGLSTFRSHLNSGTILAKGRILLLP